MHVEEMSAESTTDKNAEQIEYSKVLRGLKLRFNFNVL